jgi:acetate kinase
VRILVLNAGSSNLKASLIEPPNRAPAFERTISWIDDGRDGASATVREVLKATGEPIDAIGHRVVHGGERFTGPTRLDEAAIDGIESMTDLAPLHNPLALATIRSARQFLPDVPQVAAFDTAFHATLPEPARRYPVPDAWVRAGIRRYGFHGLSVAWSVQRASEMLDRPVEELKLVVAHLGGGCSVTAVEAGQSVDTSMGMTPLEGLMMGTRAGSIDPGIVFHRLRDGQSAEAIESDLDRRSGLVGIAGSADMGELLEREVGGDERARLAIDMFVRRAAAAIAASATNLATIDALVFTGGIGEHATSVRARICERIHLVRLEGPEREVDGDGWLGTTSSPSVLRVTAREDLVIAAQVGAVVGTTWLRPRPLRSTGT